MSNLDTVVEQLKINGNKNTEQLATLNTSVLSMNNMLGDLTDAMMLQRLDLLEMMREKKDAAPGAPASKDGDAKAGSGNLALLLAGLAAFATGFVSGILDSIQKLVKLFRIDKLFDMLKTATGKLLTRIGSIVTRIIDPIADLFRMMRGKIVEAVQDSIKIIDDMIQPIRNLFTAGPDSRIGKLFNAILEPFKFPFEGVIDDLAKPVKALFSGEEGIISKIFRRIKTTFDALIEPIQKAFGFVTDAFKIFQEGSPVMNALGSVGRIIGRLFYPFTLVMGIFDTVKGAIAGYEEEGFLGGITGAISGLLNSIVGAPLDLLKDAIGWILGKLGFENAQETLASFSIQDLITDLVMSPIEVLKRMINGLMEGIAKIAEKIPGFGAGLAEKIRGFKFEEGMTKSEERAAFGEGEKDPSETDPSASDTTKPNRYDRIQDRIARKQAPVQAQEIEDDNNALRALDGGNKIVSVQNNPTNINSSSSNSQPILTTTPSARDYSDPMLAGA